MSLYKMQDWDYENYFPNEVESIETIMRRNDPLRWATLTSYWEDLDYGEPENASVNIEGMTAQEIHAAIREDAAGTIPWFTEDVFDPIEAPEWYVITFQTVNGRNIEEHIVDYF